MPGVCVATAYVYMFCWTLETTLLAAPESSAYVCRVAVRAECSYKAPEKNVAHLTQGTQECATASVKDVQVIITARSVAALTFRVCVGPCTGPCRSWGKLVFAPVA